MIATELQDILFGTPKPTRGTANLGVIKEDEINILVHGHEPQMSEMVAVAASDPELLKEAKAAGAKGISIAGVCCTAAEMLMRFHFYFFGNPEGLVFDVLDEPPSDALWRPMERYLQGLGVDVRLGCSLNRAEQVSLGRWRAHTSAQRLDCEGLVLAVEVPALKTLFESSVDLRADPDFDDAIRALEVTSPLAVWRLFLDRPANDERPPFASMSGMGLLDRISLYERFEGESRRWSLRTGGSIVELHGYACPNDDEPAIRAELRQGLDELYPEFRGAEPVHGSWIFTRDSPAFAPGSHAKRPRVVTPFGNVVLAGDFVKLPFPTAQMERAAASGMLAANHLLDRWDVRGESLFSVPGRGFMAPTPVG